MSAWPPPPKFPYSDTPFIQFVRNYLKSLNWSEFRYTGVFMGLTLLMSSTRLLGLKYRKMDVSEENDALVAEQENLIRRSEAIKHDLLAEAESDPTGYLASRLRRLFVNSE